MAILALVKELALIGRHRLRRTEVTGRAGNRGTQFHHLRPLIPGRDAFDRSFRLLNSSFLRIQMLGDQGTSQ